MIERYLIKEGQYASQLTDFSREHICELAKSGKIKFIAVHDNGHEEEVDPSSITKPNVAKSGSAQITNAAAQMDALVNLIDASLKPALALIPRTARQPIEKAYEEFKASVEGESNDNA